MVMEGQWQYYEHYFKFHSCFSVASIVAANVGQFAVLAISSTEASFTLSRLLNFFRGHRRACPTPGILEIGVSNHVLPIFPL